jgi:hypothetical protein
MRTASLWVVVIEDGIRKVVESACGLYESIIEDLYGRIMKPQNCSQDSSL